jgi:hypothetical protein
VVSYLLYTLSTVVVMQGIQRANPEGYIRNWVILLKILNDHQLWKGIITRFLKLNHRMFSAKAIEYNHQLELTIS